MIYKRTGNIRAVQILLGHSKLDSTVRYLGVDVEDALALSEATDLWNKHASGILYLLPMCTCYDDTWGGDHEPASFR